MENQNIKLLLAFVSGLVVGSLVTKILIGEKYVEYVEETDIEVDFDDYDKTSGDIDSETSIKPTMSMIRNNRYERAKTDYSAISSGRKIEEVDEEVFKEKLNNEPDYDKPYAITEESFAEEMLTFDKLSVHYYAGDDTMLDDEDEIMDDVDAVIGIANLDMRNTDAIKHPHTIYVRNERISTDYEITISLNSYSESEGDEDES